jgi:hypothetical protein
MRHKNITLPNFILSPETNKEARDAKVAIGVRL